MVRKIRIERAGAAYRIMARGNQGSVREDVIFLALRGQ